MKIAEFLRITSDRIGPIQSVAAELIEQMPLDDLKELYMEMKELAALDEAISGWVGKVKNQEVSHDEALRNGQIGTL